MTKKPKTSRHYKGYEAIFQKYARYLALDNEGRMQEFGCDDDLGFAKKHGISRATLTTWKLDDRLWTERDKHMNAYFRPMTSAVLAGVKRRAANGDKIGAADAQLYLRYVEKWNPKIDISGSVELLSDGIDFG